jgi:hypothetical protein
MVRRFRHRWTACVLGFLTACASFSARSGAGPETPCHGSDAHSAHVIAHLRQVGAATDPKAVAWRANVHLPADTGIVLVTDPAVCAAARRAYERDADLGGKRSDFVYVVKMGNAYVVSNPTFKAGEWVWQFVYDDEFRLLAAYLG